VLGEAEIGRQRGVLTPVLLEPCAVPPPFNMIHAETVEGGLARLLDVLGAKLGRRGLARLATLLDDATAADWKAWAEANPEDPFAAEAWSRYEALSLDAQKERLAQERAAAREAAQQAAEKRARDEARAAEEAERLAKLRAQAEASAADAKRRAALEPSLGAKAERSSRFGVFFAGVVGLALIIGLSVALFAPQRAAPAPSGDAAPVRSITPAGAAALQLQGLWREDADAACALALNIAMESDADGEWLVLQRRAKVQVAGAESWTEVTRRERIVSLDGAGVVTRRADQGFGLYLPVSDTLEISAHNASGQAAAIQRWRRCE
jgi:hypothetical protein